MDRNATQRPAAYAAPTLTLHGGVVRETRGMCSCLTELSGFRPKDPPCWWL